MDAESVVGDAHFVEGVGGEEARAVRIEDFGAELHRRLDAPAEVSVPLCSSEYETWLVLHDDAVDDLSESYVARGAREVEGFCRLVKSCAQRGSVFVPYASRHLSNRPTLSTSSHSL